MLKDVTIKYLLVSCSEVDVDTPVVFDTYDDAYAKMKNDVREMVDPEDWGVDPDGDEFFRKKYWIDEISAWVRKKNDYQWRIFSLFIPESVNGEVKVEF